MKLSTKGRYGLKAMLDIALNEHNGVVPLNSIAQRQNISEAYLEQLFATLKKAELVKSIRGAQGGYILFTTPDKITVGMILRSLEGSLAPVNCVAESELPHGDSHECDRFDCCVVKGVWEKIRDSINNVVDSITLADLVDDYNKVNSDKNYMFYI